MSFSLLLEQTNFFLPQGLCLSCSICLEFLQAPPPPGCRSNISLPQRGPPWPLWKHRAPPWSLRSVLSHVCMHAQLCLTATPWTVIHQAPLSMGFLQQEYWSGLPFPSPGYLPNPRIGPASAVSLALAGRFFSTEQPGKPVLSHNSTLFYS